MASTIGPSYRDFIEGITLNPVVDVNTSNTTTDQTIPVVYGLQRIKPSIVYIRNSDYNSKSLIVVYALSEGPCYGIYRLFIDDVYVETDQGMAKDESQNGTSAELGTANTITVPLKGPYLDIAEFEFMSGSEAQYNQKSNILAGHISNSSDRFSDDDELCYLVCRFIYTDADTSPYKNIPDITVDLFGKQVVEFGAASYGVLREFTTNPAKQLWDYLTNERYGAGFDEAQLDYDSFYDAATYFDSNTNVDLTSGQQVVTKRITSNLVLDTDLSIQQNVDSMLSNNYALLPYIDGKFTLDIEKADSTEIDFTESSITQSIRITYPDANTKYNSVYYSFPDAERDFLTTRKRYPQLDADVDALVIADDGFVNTLELTFASITDPYMAERLARQYLEKSRNQAKVNFTVFKDAWQYKTGDVGRIKVNVPDIDYVEIRIISMTLRSDDLIDIEAYTHDDTWYVPFVDFFQNPVNYKKPLIPTPGGVLLPINPTQPISITPPISPNPGPGDPGNPGEPSPTPINPTQPGEDPPPTPPSEPSYVYNTSNVANAASIPTLGSKNEYYVGSIIASSGAYEYELSDFYQGSTQNARLEYNAPDKKGFYALYPALTHRNQDPGLIGYVYEILPGKFGFPLTGSTEIILWDPANPSTKATKYNTKYTWLTSEVSFKDWASYVPYLNGHPTSDGGTHQAQSGGNNPIKFATFGGIFKYTTQYNVVKGGANYRYNTLSDLHGANSGEELDIKIRYFTINNTSKSGYLPEFKSYIGEYTYTISNAEMTAQYLDISRRDYKNAAPFQTPPF